MTDRPILFSAPMIRALLAGTKSQTRRILTPRNTLFDGGRWPNWLGEDAFAWDRAWIDAGPSPAGNPGPYLKLPVINIAMQQDSGEETVHRVYPVIQPGDRLWVKEAWRTDRGMDRMNAAEIHEACLDAGYARVWAPIFFDADAERIYFENGMVAGRYRHARFMPRWASRLTLTVTEVRVQRLQEISEEDASDEGIHPRESADGFVAAYAALWTSLHGPGSWEANPWVVAISFDVRKGNIDG